MLNSSEAAWGRRWHPETNNKHATHRSAPKQGRPSAGDSGSVVFAARGHWATASMFCQAQGQRAEHIADHSARRVDENAEKSITGLQMPSYSGGATQRPAFSTHPSGQPSK